MKSDTFIDDFANRTKQFAKELNERVARFILTQPQIIYCEKHREVGRPISVKLSVEASRNPDHKSTVVYEPCASCAAENVMAAARAKLHAQGVPPILHHATIDNWDAAESAVEQRNKVCEFSKIRKGFLILLGNVGTGKSHLAVGVMRFFENAYFVKQNELLRQLRTSYRDHDVDNPVDHCQQCGLLVLDDMGLSGGGRDELPMLHAILDHRHGMQKPTIITSNLTYEALSGYLGDRLADRLRESCFRIINFAGETHRRISHEKYFS